MAATPLTWVLTYDVRDDGRRTRLARFLEAHGHRVQYSVFEVIATRADLTALLDRALTARRFDPAVDSFRGYPLDAGARADARVFGAGPVPLAPGSPIVL